MRLLFCLCITIFILAFAPFVVAQEDAKVLFQDDFSGGLDQWEVLVEGVVQGTKWTVRDGFLDSGNGDGNAQILTPEPLAAMVPLTEDTNWKNIVLEVDATVTGGVQGTGYLQIMAYMKDTSNYYALRYLTGDTPALGVERLSGLKTHEPAVWLVKRVNGKYALLDKQFPNMSVPDMCSRGDKFKGKFIRFKLTVVRNSLKGFIDSGEGYELFLEARDSSLESGSIGLGQADYSASFDNVKVTAGLASVNPQNKLATLWGKIKNQ